MSRSTALLLIAVALALYGLYAASYVPAMLVGPPQLALLVGFVLQAGCAIAAAIGVARGSPWASGALVLLGAAIAGTWLCEGFLLGIVAYLRAMLVALIALVVTLITAGYVRRRGAI